MVLADPFLIRKSMIKGIGPALASTDGLDLTMSSIGMSLEVELYEPANLSLQMNPLAPPEVHEVTSFFSKPFYAFSDSRNGIITQYCGSIIC